MRQTSAETSSTPKRRWLWIGLSVVVLAAVILVLFDAALHFRLGSDLCWSQILILQALFLILNLRIRGQFVQTFLSLLVEDLTRRYFVIMDPHLLKW